MKMTSKSVAGRGMASGATRSLGLMLAALFWCSVSAPEVVSATDVSGARASDGSIVDETVRSDPTAWEFTSSELADRWYGSLATIGLYGFGPMPLYDVEYVASARARKEMAGAYPTPLDTEAGSLLRALLADDAFEVLHFVPVYFAAATVEEALAALRDVATRPDGIPAGLTAGSRFGASVVASVLSTESQRAVLGRLLDVVDAERSSAYSVGSQSDRVSLQRLEEIRERWRRVLTPALLDYARARRLDGGRVIATPAVGREGRFFEGDPANPSDNVVVIGVGPETTPAEAVSALLRELCYPVVRVAMSDVDLEGADRREASKANDRAATRCGAILLAERAPELSAEYERYFGVGVGAPAGLTGKRSMELDNELDVLMRREIQRR